MKVLLITPKSKIRKEELKEIYNNIVMQMKTNAVAIIPDDIVRYDVVDVDATAYKKDGNIVSVPDMELNAWYA